MDHELRKVPVQIISNSLKPDENEVSDSELLQLISHDNQPPAGLFYTTDLRCAASFTPIQEDMMRTEISRPQSRVPSFVRPYSPAANKMPLLPFERQSSPTPEVCNDKKCLNLFHNHRCQSPSSRSSSPRLCSSRSPSPRLTSPRLSVLTGYGQAPPVVDPRLPNGAWC